jgi:type IV pilus assembly protein PilB
MSDDTPVRSRPSQYLPAVAKGMGDMLLRERVVSVEQLKNAAAEAAKTGKHLGSTLQALGYVDKSQMVDFLSRQYQVPSIDLSQVEISPDVTRLVPRELCERHQILPIAVHGSTLVVALADPGNYHAIDDLKFKTGLNIEIVVAPEDDIAKVRGKLYGSVDQLQIFEEMSETLEIMTDDDNVNTEELKQSSEEAPVVKLVNLILIDAIKRRASDIHIESYEKAFRVRYRVDGVLAEIMRPPLKLRNAIVSRIKIMSQLDIAERRLPQDGRIKLKLADGKECDFRVSVLPCLFGEKVVMRLLDKANLQTDMTKLGFDQSELDKFKHAIHQPFGMVLVTGPTGSGKTTTLYSALTELNKVSENCSTAEDPVEFNLEGINQVQMNDAIGLTFASVLRSFLRQDPDVLMVGHMVLSTLHTNDAPSTISRLLNMGVEPFMVTAALNLIAAQRLVRRICGECKAPFLPDRRACLDAGMSEADYDSAGFMKGVGCKTCNDSGYKGRVAIYEIMPISDNLRDAVLQGSSAGELKRVAVDDGLQTLRMSALNKLRQGLTTLEEVLRVTRND